MLKKLLKVMVVVLLLAVVVGGAFAAHTASAFDEVIAKRHDVPVPTLERATAPEVLERGAHLARSVAGCASKDCHGADFAGGNEVSMGPVGTFRAPNITPGGAVAQYSDGELARLIIRGVKKDGRTLLFMPCEDWSWLPDEDVTALVSFLRTVPASPKVVAPSQVGLLGKILDRQGTVKIDVAAQTAYAEREVAPPPAPTAAYGAFLARACEGCHGEHLSGGPIPGAPPDMPVPQNLTLHASGLATWKYEDFDKLLASGIRPDGTRVNAFMPIDMVSQMNETERRALWAYLGSLPPTPFGGR